jgi:hypothetical protein
LAAYGDEAWQEIDSKDLSNFPNGITRFVYNDWVVPTNVKSTRVFIRAVIWNDNTGQQISPLPYIATSGQFSIGTSMAQLLSDTMIAGEFVTTVSEHFVVNLANPSVGSRASELGNDALNDTTPNDYGGTALPVKPVWQENTIMRIGHLRFTTYTTDPTNDWSPTMKLTPIPQGRYGHKLFVDGNKLVVVGGASWMPKLHLNWQEDTTGSTGYDHFQYALTTRYFWVIENGNFPVYSKPAGSDQFDRRYEPLAGGHYVGHIAYTLTNSTAYWSPSPQYSFNAESGSATNGRAFFGFAKAGDEWTAIGGLENVGSDYTITELISPEQPVNQMTYSGNVLVQATSRTIGLQTQAGVPSWEEREAYLNSEEVYNLSAFSLDNRLIAYGGQTEFCQTTVYDPHIPDPGQRVSNTTALYQQSGDDALSSWHQMTNFGNTNSVGATAGTPDIVFAADALVATTIGGGFTSVIDNFYIYRYGGFQKLFGVVIADVFQGLGAFSNAQSGTPYSPSSEFTVTPSKVAADGYTPAIARVVLVDYFDQPVANKYVLVTVGSSSLPPADTDEVKIVPFEGNGASDGYMLTDDQGVATFKLTSSIEKTHTATAYWTSTPNSNEGSLNPTTVTFTKDNVPDQTLSDISTNKDQVIADGTDAATITVTLHGRKSGIPDTPLAGIYVKIFTNRNPIDGSIIDTIAPASAVTNASGQASFTVKSDTKGLSTISAVYSMDVSGLMTSPIPLSATVTIRFVGKIISLNPDFEKQGRTVGQLTATGAQTSWRDTDPITTVGFNRPSNIDLTGPNGLVLDASPLTTTDFTLSINNKPAGTAVQLKILNTGNNWGSFLPPLIPNQDRHQLNLTTNGSGQATFTYEHGSNTGALNLEVAVTGGETKTFKLILANLTAPYSVEVMADPSSLDDNTNQSAVRAALYRWTSIGKQLITDSNIQVNFLADNGTILSPKNIDATRGTADTIYTRGTDRGNHNIFATISYDGYSLAGMVTIGETTTSEGITFTGVNVSIDSSKQIIDIYEVDVAEDATLGFWTFFATTKLEDETFETVTHPFQVLDKNASLEPYIESISPSSVLPGANQVLTIKGKFTNFFTGSSKVTFTPYTNSDGSGITFTDSNVVVQDRYTIKVTIDVANDAVALGYWNIKVSTNLGAQNIETAELAGNTDLLVTTTNGLILDITASPNQLHRDGKEKSTLTTFAGKIDNLTGQITPFSNIDVAFSLEGGTGGTLQAVTGKTGADGTFTNYYVTDSGSESAEIYVRASATIEGAPSTDAALILRIVGEGDFITLAANPTSLPLEGDDNTSTLTATVIDTTGQPIANGTSVTFLLDGSGTINPNQKAASSGIATSTYYRADGLLTPTSITIVAKVTIPGVGAVFSNQIVINIGLADSDYYLNFTTDKTQVPVGGIERAKLTALLTYKGTPQRNWPMTFWLLAADTGDYLTVVSGRTNSQGLINTEFVSGLFPGNVIVSARPSAGLPTKQVAITKTMDQTIDSRLSTISVVPAFVPADGTSVATVTITLRNSRYAPLAGKSVTVASDRNTTADTIDSFTPTGAQLTDVNGKVCFAIRSSTTGASNIRATIGSLVLGPATVHFEDATNLVSVNFDVKVPLEAKSYDREIKIYLREQTANMGPAINEVYVTDPATDKLTGVPESIYLHPNKTYIMWAKGHYHLARTRQFNSPTSAGTTITLDFTDTTTGKGLFAADLAGDETEGSGIFPGFNDNKINNLDIPVFINSWFVNSYLADLTGDFIVNTLDIAYWAANWFHNPGAVLP